MAKNTEANDGSTIHLVILDSNSRSKVAGHVVFEYARLASEVDPEYPLHATMRYVVTPELHGELCDTWALNPALIEKNPPWRPYRPKKWREGQDEFEIRSLKSFRDDQKYKKFFVLAPPLDSGKIERVQDPADPQLTAFEFLIETWRSVLQHGWKDITAGKNMLTHIREHLEFVRSKLSEGERSHIALPEKLKDIPWLVQNNDTMVAALASFSPLRQKMDQWYYRQEDAEASLYFDVADIGIADFGQFVKKQAAKHPGAKCRVTVVSNDNGVHKRIDRLNRQKEDGNPNLVIEAVSRNEFFTQMRRKVDQWVNDDKDKDVFATPDQKERLEVLDDILHNHPYITEIATIETNPDSPHTGMQVKEKSQTSKRRRA